MRYVFFMRKIDNSVAAQYHQHRYRLRETFGIKEMFFANCWYSTHRASLFGRLLYRKCRSSARGKCCARGRGECMLWPQVVSGPHLSQARLVEVLSVIVGWLEAVLSPSIQTTSHWLSPLAKQQTLVVDVFINVCNESTVVFKSGNMSMFCGNIDIKLTATAAK